MCNYSIYVRTLGKGGEKYAQLLKSIQNQTIPPRKVVIVLPYGYEPPKERLGYEIFEFSQKGMLQQRIYAIYHVETEYILLLDDDVSFENSFVEKLYATIKKANADCAIAPLTNDRQHQRKLSNFIGRITRTQIIRNEDTPFYIEINRLGGYSIQKELCPNKVYYTQSAHGSHCFIKSKCIQNIHFEEELWLEKSGYALPDDQVMFYKIFKHGYKIAVCTNSNFYHLDAASTGRIDRKIKLFYAKSHNFLIFWYKFIYKDEKKYINRLKDKIAITYRIISEFIFLVIPTTLVYFTHSYIVSYVKGLKDGIKAIRSNRF